MEFPESQDSKKFVNGFQVLEWPKFFVVSSSFELGNVTGLRKDDFFFATQIKAVFNSLLHSETLITEAEKPRHFIRLLSKLLLVVLLL